MRRRPFFRAASALAAVATAAVLLVPSVAVAAEIPALGKVHAGIYSDQFYATSDLDGIGAAAGKRLTFAGTFHNITENDGVSTPSWSNTREILEGVWDGKSTPFANVTINASSYRVARGDFDAKIREWATHVKQFLDKGAGRSLIIAPMQEMNGNWTPYGCDAANFRAAYRRFVTIFRDLGIGETQVRWAFAPNGWTSPGCGAIADYYPGDSYADVLAVSAYNFGTCVGTRWESVTSVFGAALDELRTTVNALKPYLIAQTAAPRSGCGGNQDTWSTEMFDYLAGDPNVVGLIWFNLVKETNWKVWQSGSLTAGWRNGLGSSSTVYQWPLTSWFTSGTLTVGVPSGPGDKVVVVGGPNAVSHQAEWQILGDIGGLPSRVYGDNRYATAAAISQRYSGTSAPEVFVATGLDFPDALALGAAAGTRDGPLLLTASTSLPAETRTELSRLRPSRIYVAGGSGVVSEAVVSALAPYASSGRVDRLAGANRYATAAAISRAFFDQTVDTVFLTTGQNFPDALSAGAAAASASAPVLLNPSSGLHPAVRAEILRITPSRVVLIGGTGALDQSVADAVAALGVSVERWAGPDRYATSVVVSRRSNGPGASRVFVATGETFPDALAAVAAAGKLGVPLLLTTSSGLPPNVLNELNRIL